MNLKKKITLGIIGKNFGYKVIYKSFLKNKKFKVLGFASKSNKNKINLPKNIKLYTDWKKLILNKNIDAVVISAPPTLHLKIIKFAVKHNKHIFCEKPFTCSKKQADIICKLMKKERKIFHFVNYEFVEIDAFKLFKKKILKKKIKIKKINLNWFIKIKRSNKIWKGIHKKGGGIMFNYVCHAIYYLEFLFGKIRSTNSNIYLSIKKNMNFLNSTILFKSGLSAKIKISINSNNKAIHELKAETDKFVYVLKSKVNSLSDQFFIEKINKSLKKKGVNKKILFKNKYNKTDFRINPTFNNSKKFSNSILKKKLKKPNFFNAQRVHLIIEQMVNSSNEKKEMFIN